MTDDEFDAAYAMWESAGIADAKGALIYPDIDMPSWWRPIKRWRAARELRRAMTYIEFE